MTIRLTLIGFVNSRQHLAVCLLVSHQYLDLALEPAALLAQLPEQPKQSSNRATASPCLLSDETIRKRTTQPYLFSFSSFRGKLPGGENTVGNRSRICLSARIWLPNAASKLGGLVLALLRIASICSAESISNSS